MRISVVGTGYLGATHAACMAELGHDVVGIDVDPTRVEALAAGRVPFFEPELPEVLARHVASGRLRFSAKVADAADAEVHFVCVGTPQRGDSLAADTSYVESAFAALAEVVAPESLLVGKSTVPVGTAAGLLATLDGRARLAWNPEFLREGHAVADTLRPDRLVIGVRDEADAAPLLEVYRPLLDAGTPLLLTNLPTAELVKSSANAFLATKISFINAIAELCEVTGADVTQLADALGHDPRIGRRFLDAGLGFGGGCLPKDIRALLARAGELGAGQALSFLAEVDAINMRRRQRVVELTREVLGGSVLGQTVAVLGAAFKPESDDVRDSPALNVAGQLQLQGAQVRVYDPQATEPSRRVFPTLTYAESVEAACRGADVVLHLTEWKEFRRLDPAALGELVRRRHVVDARNCLDAAAWRAAGWDYRGLGRL